MSHCISHVSAILPKHKSILVAQHSRNYPAKAFRRLVQALLQGYLITMLEGRRKFTALLRRKRLRRLRHEFGIGISGHSGLGHILTQPVIPLEYLDQRQKVSFNVLRVVQCIEELVTNCSVTVINIKPRNNSLGKCIVNIEERK